MVISLMICVGDILVNGGKASASSGHLRYTNIYLGNMGSMVLP